MGTHFMHMHIPVNNLVPKSPNSQANQPCVLLKSLFTCYYLSRSAVILHNSSSFLFQWLQGSTSAAVGFNGDRTIMKTLHTSHHTSSAIQKNE